MRRIIPVAIAAIIIVLLPFILVTLHGGLAGFLHRQLAYRVIVQQITGADEEPLAKVKDVMAYVHLNETELNDWSQAEDVHVLHDLIHHIGWSDQKANAMAHLLQPLGIDARMVIFPCHSFAEVRINGQHLLFDPDGNGHFFDRDSPGQIAALEAVLHRPRNLMTTSGTDWQDYPHSDVTDCGRFQRYDFPSEGMTWHRRILAGMMAMYHSIGGDGFAQRFNRWHLARHHDGEENLFYRTRCLQLFGDAPDAAAAYAAMDGLRGTFFLFRTLVETGDMAGAHRTLIDFQRMAVNGPATDPRYVEVMDEYLHKLRSMDGSRLMRTLALDEARLADLFHLLDVAQSE